MSTLSKTCQFMATHLSHQRFVTRIAFLSCLFVLTASCGSAPSPPVLTSPSMPKIIERHGPAGTPSVKCQDGEHLVGGGYSGGATFPNPVQASYPSDANTWSVTGGITGTTALADCLMADSVMTQITTGNSGINPAEGSLVKAQASCPSGWIATGGGFIEKLTQKMIVETSAPTEIRDGWMVQSHAHGVAGNPQPAIQAFAVCLLGSLAVSLGGPKSDFMLQPGSSKTNKVDTSSCPRGYLLTSGGYITTNPPSDQTLSDTFATNIYPVDGPTTSDPSGQVVKAWFLTALNNSTQSTNGTVELVCIKL